MKRKDFLKKTALAAGATFLAPLFVNSDSEAKTLVKLNYKPEPLGWSNENLTLAWIGHSTILINIFGKWIITDPVM